MAAPNTPSWTAAYNERARMLSELADNCEPALTTPSDPSLPEDQEEVDSDAENEMMSEANQDR